MSEGMPAQHAHSDACPEGIAHSTDLVRVRLRVRLRVRVRVRVC